MANIFPVGGLGVEDQQNDLSEFPISFYVTCFRGVGPNMKSIGEKQEKFAEVEQQIGYILRLVAGKYLDRLLLRTSVRNVKLFLGKQFMPTAGLCKRFRILFNGVVWFYAVLILQICVQRIGPFLPG